MPKMIRVKIDNLYCGLEGPVDEVLNTIYAKSREAEAKGFTNIELESQLEPYSDDYRLVLMGTRPETDEERKKRLEKAKRSRQQEEGYMRRFVAENKKKLRQILEEDDDK